MFSTIFAIALIPFLGAILGGLFFSFVTLPMNIISILQHFVGGIVVGAVTIELLPQILHAGSHLGVGLGFLFGAALMLFLHELTSFLSVKKKGTIKGLLFASVLDLFIVGILIGISFIAGIVSGLFIACFLTLCVFLLNGTFSGALKKRKISSLFCSLSNLGVACALLVGILGGYLIVLQLFEDILVETLAFGIAALLFLGIEELLEKAHDTALASAPFFVGFLVVLFFRL